MGVRVLTLGLLLASAGCYAEATTGIYRVSDGLNQSGPAYEFGFSAGFYIDPKPVHIGVGVGGENMRAEYEDDNVPPAEVRHSTMQGLQLQFGGHLFDFAPGVGSIWLFSSFSMSNRDAVELEVADPNYPDVDFDGWSYAAFVGPQLKAWFGTTARTGVGVWLAIGPAIMTSDADYFGRSTFAGFQVRYAVYGLPRPSRGGGLATLFRNSTYSPGASLQRDINRFGSNASHNAEMQCIRDPNCRVVNR